MTVTITKFRKELFSLVESALAGESVEFTHKGQIIRLVPEKKISKLARLTPMQVINPDGPGLEGADKELFAEMEREWTKDWDEQGL